jgi:hypothetical protein
MVLQISSVLLVGKAKAIGWKRSPIPRYPFRRQPPLAPGDSNTYVCQNVAGMWIKYGVKFLNYETSLPSEIPLYDATIC